MLRVTLLGNLGGDPELRYNAKGAAVVSFNVAVNQIRTGQDGERQESTEWFRVRASGPKAEYVQQRLGKGTRALVVGRLQIGHYVAKTGEQRTSFDVWADDVQSLMPRQPGGDGDLPGEVEGESLAEPAGISSLAGRRGSNGRTAVATRGSGGEPDLEDLPF
jgi:single-strand DNA-binding protein